MPPELAWTAQAYLFFEPLFPAHSVPVLRSFHFPILMYAQGRPALVHA